MGGTLHGFFGRLVGAGLDDVWIAIGAASTGTRGSAFVGPPAWTTEIAGDGDDGSLAKIDVELVVVTVSDGAFLVVDHRKHDAAGRLHGAGIGNVHHFRHTAGNGERSARLHSYEQTAFANKAFKIGEALIAEAAANVVRGVQTRSHKVGSFSRIFPRARITTHRQAAKHGAQTRGATTTHGWENNDVEFFAEVLVFAQPGIGDVGVWNLQLLHRNAEPAIILSVLPIVDESDAGNGKCMRLDAQRGVAGMDFNSEIFGSFFELGTIGVPNYEGAGFVFDAVGFKGIFCGFHGNAGQAEAESSEGIVGVVLDEEDFALAVDSARGIDPAHFLHGGAENGEVGDARGPDIAQRAESPTGVIIGTRIARAVILGVEGHIGKAAVGLVHADDVAACRNDGIGRFLFFFRFTSGFGFFT